MALNHTLSRQAAEDLFDQEAILFGEMNAIPEYRVVEIFGEWAGAFFEKHVQYNGYFDGGLKTRIEPIIERKNQFDHDYYANIHEVYAWMDKETKKRKKKEL